MTAPKHVPRRFEGLRINNACSVPFLRLLSGVGRPIEPPPLI